MVVCFFFGWPFVVKAEDSDNERKSFSAYDALRDYVLGEMAQAKKRLWIYTEYLTDGEISSALFVARYRQLDVRVLLGHKKAQGYMSRLSTLKSNQIEVYLKPRGFNSEYPTVILIDDRLISIDRELDFLKKTGDYHLKLGKTQDVYEFSRVFSFAMDQKKPAVPKQLPLVGRSKRVPYEDPPVISDAMRGEKSGSESSKNLAPVSDEAYHYKRIKEKKPPGIPDRLPRELKYQERLNEAPLLDDPSR